MNKENLLLVELAIQGSKKNVDDFSGFNFRKIEGNLWSFECLAGSGICWNDGSDRFKYSPAILLID